MMLLLRVDTFAGDTTKPVKFNVYALTEDLIAKGATDTLLYTSYDPRKAGHMSADAKPIFTFTFPDQANGVYTNSLKVRMHETSESRAFVNRLIGLDKLDANGLANSNVGVYKSDSLFLETFKGLWVEPAADNPEDAAVYSLAITKWFN